METRKVIIRPKPPRTTCPHTSAAYEAGMASVTGSDYLALSCFCSDCAGSFWSGQKAAAQATLRKLREDK